MRWVSFGLVSVLAGVGALGSVSAQSPAGKTVVVAQAADPGTLDEDKVSGPLKRASILCHDWQWLGYDVRDLGRGVRVVNTTKLMPRVIEKWDEGQALPDRRWQYTLTLRRGARHHSGNEVTTEDLKYTLLRRAAMKRDGLERTVGFWQSTEETVRVVDRHTLQIITQRHSPWIHQILTQRRILDSKLLAEQGGSRDVWGEGFLKTHCAGGGPFRLTQSTTGVDMVFERFGQWWGSQTWEKVDINRVVLRTVPSSDTRVLLLRRGEVDIALDVPPRQLAALKRVSGVKVLSFPSTNQLFVGMNSAVKPFDNLKVRQAMAYAFPYKEASEQIFGGAARALPGPIPTDVDGARKVAPHFTDLERAKRLLNEAGFPNGFETTLAFSANMDIHEDLAILFKANLEKIGVRATVQKTPEAVFNTATTRTKSLGFFFYEALWWIRDPFYILNLAFFSDTHNNVANFRDPQVDALLTEAGEVQSAAERLKILRTVQDIIIDKVPWVFVAQPNFSLPVRESIDGYVYQNTELHHLWLLKKR